jgi:RNA polymerase sigma-70 factor (ECF subfamily)
MHPHLTTRTAPPMPGMSDADLPREIASGNQDAFQLLMRRHNKLLYRTARAILKDDSEAEDAVQDAYLLAYRGMAKFRHEAKLSTWLVRIVVNEAVRRLRANARRARVIQPGGIYHQENMEAANAVAKTPGQPDEALARLQLRRSIEAKIDALPDLYRVVFVLRAVQELPVKDTAKALGILETTVRIRFFRARHLLRQALSQEMDVAVEDVFPFDGVRCDRIVFSVIERLGSAGVSHH